MFENTVIKEVLPEDMMGDSNIYKDVYSKIVNELYDLFKFTVQIEPEKDLNTAQKIIMEFGKQIGNEYKPERGQMQYMNNIVNSSEFQEFFKKRLFIGNVSDDKYMRTLQGSEFDRNIFTIIKDIVSKETGIFDKSVVTALSNIPTNTFINQILSENTGKPIEIIEKDTDRDYIMTSQEALEYGLVDLVIPSKNKAKGE